MRRLRAFQQSLRQSLYCRLANEVRFTYGWAERWRSSRRIHTPGLNRLRDVFCALSCPLPIPLSARSAMSGLSFLPTCACGVHPASTSAFLRGDVVSQARPPAVACAHTAERRRTSRTRVAGNQMLRACLQPPDQEGRRMETGGGGGDGGDGGDDGFALADLPTLPLCDAPERPGAYAVRNADGQLAYLGYSRNVAAMIRFHEERVGSEQAACCQVYAPEDRPVGPDLLESVLEYWVRENQGVVPDGNLAYRVLWEGSEKNAAPGTPEAQAQQQKSTVDSVPYRARKTAKRVATSRRSPFDGTPSTSSRRTPTTAEEDYVYVDVDPLDPFSPGRSSDAPKWSSSPFVDEDGSENDWLPFAALFGVASVLWLFQVLSNTIPAAAPSLGM